MVTDVSLNFLTSILNIINILKINHKLKPEARNSKLEAQRSKERLKTEGEKVEAQS